MDELTIEDIIDALEELEYEELLELQRALNEEILEREQEPELEDEDEDEE